MKFSIFALVLSLVLPLTAQASPAKCLIKVDGKTYLDGVCEFTPQDGGGFTIGVGSAAHSKYFAYVSEGDNTDTSYGYWNGVEANSAAHDSLGLMLRDGACRYNKRARICAWSL